MTLWDKVEKACEAVDTWPDWKLDTISMQSRNKRRAAGEILPKLPKGQAQLEKIKHIIHIYFSPWGVAKAAMWEDISNDGPFSAEEVLRLIKSTLEMK